MHTPDLRIGVLSLAAAVILASGIASAQQATGPTKLPEVELDTTEGKILIELNSEKAPITVENFLKYVKDGHYDGTIFHRVIPNFMIQGGGMDDTLAEKPTRPPIRNEAGNGLKNKKYTLAMARTQNPDSATSQFFINLVNNDYLNRNAATGDAGYAVFGRVVKGLEVVDKISRVKTHSQPSPEIKGLLMRDVPIKPIVIKSAKVVNKDE